MGTGNGTIGMPRVPRGPRIAAGSDFWGMQRLPLDWSSAGGGELREVFRVRGEELVGHLPGDV